GAFIAVASLYLFGESALTYSLAATLTIFVTYRLTLHAGVLVAALTAVAMVPSVGDAYFYNYFPRLATTTIGLATSTLITFSISMPMSLSPLSQPWPWSLLSEMRISTISFQGWQRLRSVWLPVHWSTFSSCHQNIQIR